MFSLSTIAGHPLPSIIISSNSSYCTPRMVKLERSKLVRLLQFLNMFCINFALLVSKFETLSVVNF